MTHRSGPGMFYLFFCSLFTYISVYYSLLMHAMTEDKIKAKKMGANDMTCRSDLGMFYLFFHSLFTKICPLMHAMTED